MENKTAYQPKTLFRCRQWHIFSTGKSCSLCGNRCSPYTDFASLSPQSIVRPPVPCFDCFFFQSVVCRSPVGKLSAACPRVIYNSAPDSATSRVAGVASDRVGVHFYAHIKTIPPSETRLSLDLEFCVAAKGARFQFSHLSSPPHSTSSAARAYRNRNILRPPKTLGSRLQSLSAQNSTSTSARRRCANR